MTEEHWTDTYDYAVRLFGQAPRPQDEEIVLEAFARSPQHVKAQIEAIADAAEIRWKWSALAARLDRAKPSRELIVTKAQEREHRIEAAKTWITNAGCHMTETEVTTELFGSAQTTPSVEYLEQVDAGTRDAPGRPLYDALLRTSIRMTRERGTLDVPNSEGLLHAWRDDTTLRSEMLDLWREHRPTAEQIELDAGERAAEWKHGRQQLRELRKQRLRELDAKQETPAETLATTGDFT